MSENNNLPILREENVQMIAQSAPDTYNTNALSSQRCADYGEKLLAEIQRGGMTDALDKQCADYIDKSRRTLKAMNERRSPITKLFDQIRSEFTGMENAIDPTKKDTVPYKIQQTRNAYAAKKREEAERARQEEMRRQQREQALNRYKQESEDDYRRQFDNLVTEKINELTSLNKSLTVENYDEVCNKIKGFNITLGNEWFQQCQCHAHKPYEVTDAEANEIRQSILNRLSKQFKEQFQAEVGEYRDTITDALPSKKKELERMAKANAEEQARIKAELEAREAAETRRLDEERRRKEEEAKAAKQVQQSANEMDGLFAQNAVATPVGYQPKTSVKQKIVCANADGILAAVSMWWSKEGQFLPIEELSKIFKKQLTFCEKVANDKDNPEFINSPFVRYEEEVKAK
ncbi:hypothetical protein [Muribaculum sp.]|uniref:hypothetical protein n=1 Tax=Muribaculum sp. TaxID=1918611 RepID=UPI00258DE3C1|nr:hypothetical protein [Muribaculum sp.]MCX4279428.1 hypothetical protein [Muribaculum sp.]